MTTRPELSVVRREQAALLGGKVSWLAVGQPSPARPTFVLLHGIPSSAELWRGVLDHLGEAGRHAIAPDLPGYGRTRIDHGLDHGIEGAVDLVEALLDHLDLGSVWLVGHDLGGVAAQLLATEQPQRLAGLTLTHCPIEDRWPPPAMRPVFAAARRGLARIVSPTLATATAQLVQRAGADDDQGGLTALGRTVGMGLTGTPWRPADARRVFVEGKVASAGGRAAFARHVTAVAHVNNALTQRTAPKLAGLAMPTQVIWGSLDRVLPWAGVGDRLRELLPDPRVTLIEGAGHFVPGERPGEFAAALLRVN